MSQAGYTPIQLYYSTTAAATPSAGNLANGELAINITDGKLFYKDNGGVVRVLANAAGPAGDVVGPGSSTDNALVRFDGTTGKLVQSSVGVLSDAGALSGLTSVAATTFTGALTGNASTVTNGVYTSGDQTIAGVKTFSSPIAGSITGNAATATTATTATAATSAGRLASTNFTIEESGGTLQIKYGATVVASISSTGAITSGANITAFGTP